jgi:anti-anti-sigma regulatory factor
MLDGARCIAVQGLPPLGPRRPLRLRTRRYGAACVVVLEGELDADGAVRLEAFLRRRDLDSSLILDLWGVTHCDPAGVSAIQAAKEHVEDAGWGLAVVAEPDELCAAALKAAGQLPVFATRAAARAALLHAPS